MPDREKVIKGLECCDGFCDWETGCPYYDELEPFDCEKQLREDALALLKAQEPVVHGRWIDENLDDSLDPRMRCSICTGVESPLLKWRYCPNCGAKMDGERRDERAAD